MVPIRIRVNTQDIGHGDLHVVAVAVDDGESGSPNDGITIRVVRPGGKWVGHVVPLPQDLEVRGKVVPHGPFRHGGGVGRGRALAGCWGEGGGGTVCVCVYGVGW